MIGVTGGSCVPAPAPIAEVVPGLEYLAPPLQADPSALEAVRRLDPVRFKQNIYELSQFGGRAAGTRHNHAAVDWVELQLQRMGYTNITRDRFGAGRFAHDNLYVTRLGTKYPNETYIVSAHIDGTGMQGADDNASGCAVVLELARVLASPDIHLDRSVRLIFWNASASRMEGSAAYANTRFRSNGVEEPPGSGLFPEPKWLGVIQHDMVLYDHGTRGGPEQSREADIDIEYTRLSRKAPASAGLAEVWRRANSIYAKDFPAEISDQMRNTDSYSFREMVATISVSGNRQFSEIAKELNKSPERARDTFIAYSDADFRLAFNVVQTSMGGLAHLAGLRIVTAGR